MLEWRHDEEALLKHVEAHYQADADVAAIRAQLVTIYKRHNTRKLVDLDDLLEEWQGDEAELLAMVLQKYPDTDSTEEKLSRRIQAAKSIHTLQRHSSVFGEFGKPPSLEHTAEEKAAEERLRNTEGILAALRAEAAGRTAEQQLVVETWAATVEFFQREVKSERLRQ